MIPQQAACDWRSAKGVFGRQLREQGEVAIACQQFVDAMHDTNRGHTSVVDQWSTHPAAPDESLKYWNEAVGFTDQSHARGEDSQEVGLEAAIL